MIWPESCGGPAAGRSRRSLAGPPLCGAAREDDGHAGAEHDPRDFGFRQIFELLGQHVPGFDVESERSVDDATKICPRSAILHSAAASSVDLCFVVTVFTAARIATFGVEMPSGGEIDCVLHNVRLSSRVG